MDISSSFPLSSRSLCWLLTVFGAWGRRIPCASVFPCLTILPGPVFVLLNAATCSFRERGRSWEQGVSAWAPLLCGTHCWLSSASHVSAVILSSLDWNPTYTLTPVFIKSENVRVWQTMTLTLTLTLTFLVCWWAAWERLNIVGAVVDDRVTWWLRIGLLSRNILHSAAAEALKKWDGGSSRRVRVWGSWVRGYYPREVFWKYRCKSVQFGAFRGHQVIKSETIFRPTVPLLKVGRKSPSLPYRSRGPCLDWPPHGDLPRTCRVRVTYWKRLRSSVIQFYPIIRTRFLTSKVQNRKFKTECPECPVASQIRILIASLVNCVERQTELISWINSSWWRPELHNVNV